VPAEQSDDSQHERIVIAATACFERWGVPRTRMEDIAKQAGVSRPTLYRYFASKDALQQAVMVRHIRRRAAALHQRVPRSGPSGPLILQALLAGATEPSDDHVSESVLGTEVVHDTARLVGESAAIHEAMHHYWEPFLQYAADRDELRDGVTIESAVRWLTMIVFYLLTLPEVGPPPERLAADLETFVVGAIIKP
jgi:AcrR family transcriptional regulator